MCAGAARHDRRGAADGGIARGYCAGRPAVPHTREHFHLVAFNGHSPAASVAALPPPQLRVERVEIDVETGRHTVDRDDERLTV